MAAPFVAGVAGLMLARFPDLSHDSLRTALLDGADPEFYKSDFANGYNYKCYYPQVEQDAVRQPLLGTGLLNANAAINRSPSQNLPLFSDLDRVRRGCSVVGDAESASLPLATMMVPLLLATFYSLQLRRAMFRKRRSSPSRLP